MSDRPILSTFAFIAVALLSLAPAEAGAQSPAGTTPLSGAWIVRQERGDDPMRDAVVRFGEDGTFTISKSGEVWITGEYLVEATGLTLRDRSGPFACLWDDGSARVGVYTWSIADDRLRLAMVSDDCAGRADTIAFSWFTRKESAAE